MDERLSDMVDAALRWHSECRRPIDADIARAWPALAELLTDVGIFARDMERIDSLYKADRVRQCMERDAAAQRLYGRLLDPPHAENVVSLPVKGIGRVLPPVGRLA